MQLRSNSSNEHATRRLSHLHLPGVVDLLSDLPPEHHLPELLCRLQGERAYMLRRRELEAEASGHGVQQRRRLAMVKALDLVKEARAALDLVE